jgi:GT2 family glycosyltransferase
MHPVLILTHNNLSLTQRAIASVLAQDIPVEVFVYDNGSTDGTRNWLSDNDIFWWGTNSNAGVSWGWNSGLRYLFTDREEFEHVLCPNNDVVLAPWTYRMLLECNVPFVTGIAVDDESQIAVPPQAMPLDPHPDFSLFCMRRAAWEAVGEFSEAMVHYASDTDWHVRAHRLGIPLWKANIPYLHFRSSTLNNASPKEQAKIQAQAHADREVFQSIYGCVPGTEAYEKLFQEG